MLPRPSTIDSIRAQLYYHPNHQHLIYLTALKSVCDFNHTKHNAFYTPEAAYKNFRLSLFSTGLVYLFTIPDDSYPLNSLQCYVEKQRTAEYSPFMKKRRETIEFIYSGAS